MENRRVFNRILKWGWKNKVSISEAQLDSADFCLGNYMPKHF